MKYSLLVAIREYVENAKTKGFWIGIMIFPIMILIGIQVPRYLDKATPTRHFILVDQSGKYKEVINRELLRFHTRKKSEAYNLYFAKHSHYRKTAKTDQKIDWESVPKEAFNPAKMIEDAKNFGPEDYDSLSSDEGWKQHVKKSEPFLAKDRPDFKPPRLKFRRVEVPEELSTDGKPTDIARSLKPYLLEEKSISVDGQDEGLFAAIIIPPDVKSKKSSKGSSGKSGNIEYWSINLTDKDLQNLLERSINAEYRRLTYLTRGVDPGVVKDVQRVRVPFNAKNPKKAVGQEDVSVADVIRQYAPIAFVYLLWIAVFSVSQMLLNNTIEEKSNRIIEVLLSSVTSRELMQGKLLGIAAVGLTMTGAWILSLITVLNLYRSPELEFVDQILEVLWSSNLLPAFGLYFLFGYLFYSGIFLAIGSICNTIKEAQNFMGPMMMIMFVPLVTMFFIPKDPNGTLATILSWIPLYTPFIMMNRAAADPPLLDQVGTLILMVLSTLAVLWLCGKIFRIGILRTGQPPKLLELVRWIKNPA